MRIPIYPSDLIPNRGFKLIAKALRNAWPAARPINLMAAQETLARGFGYRDFHDVGKSSQTASPDAEVPTLAELQERTHKAIFESLQLTGDTGVTSDGIERVTMALPIYELSAFRGLEQKTDVHHADTDKILQASTKAMRRAQRVGVGSAGGVPLTHRVLNRRELKNVKKFVKKNGHLRDQILLASVFSLLRPIEIFDLKVEDVIFQGDTVAVMTMKDMRGQRKTKRIPVPVAIAPEKVASYVAKAGLSKHDYLFPSRFGSDRRMSSLERSKILHSWLSGAEIEPTAVGFATMRVSIALAIYLSSSGNPSDAIRSLVRHSVPGHMLQYVSDLSNPPAM